MRKFRLFALSDKASESSYRVEAIHNAEGYRRLRSALADSYDVGEGEPDIQVVDVDLLGDRELVLRHTSRKGVGLAEAGREATLRHVRNLWGYGVRLEDAPATLTA